MRPPRALLLTSLLMMLVPAAVRAAEDFQENVGFSPNHLVEAGSFGGYVVVARS